MHHTNPAPAQDSGNSGVVKSRSARSQSTSLRANTGRGRPHLFSVLFNVILGYSMIDRRAPAPAQSDR